MSAEMFLLFSDIKRVSNKITKFDFNSIMILLIRQRRQFVWKLTRD